MDFMARFSESSGSGSQWAKWKKGGHSESHYVKRGDDMNNMT